MEFHEKLQELRKNREMTQEELAEALYVSRTAISKWESGRGYPSIDSLRTISSYFSVSIDDLLSGEKLLFIAEKENKSNMQDLCNLLFGITDIISVIMIILPLYPNEMNGHVYSVNLLNYTQTTLFNYCVYWGWFVLLIVLGSVKLLWLKYGNEKGIKRITAFSIAIHVCTILFLSLARAAYAMIVAFLLLGVKIVLFFRSVKQ